MKRRIQELFAVIVIITIMVFSATAVVTPPALIHLCVIAFRRQKHSPLSQRSLSDLIRGVKAGLKSSDFCTHTPKYDEHRRPTNGHPAAVRVQFL